MNAHAPTYDKCDNLKDSFYEELECVFTQFLLDFIIILLRDFSPKVGREHIFKPTAMSDSLQKTNKCNRDLSSMFATSVNIFVRSLVFAYQDKSYVHSNLSWWEYMDWSHLSTCKTTVKYTWCLNFWRMVDFDNEPIFHGYWQLKEQDKSLVCRDLISRC